MNLSNVFIKAYGVNLNVALVVPAQFLGGVVGQRLPVLPEFVGKGTLVARRTIAGALQTQTVEQNNLQVR
jgi:hypothetical protein